ncbi:hypothetical protein B0H19DRAFT_464631 [Mycena capillaripes]|nr:hypothetical protein B0H19DRAFT_464631 [Mycena capillaripes]
MPAQKICPKGSSARRKPKRTRAFSVSVSSIEDLGNNFTEEEKTRFQAQLTLTNRRSFKNKRNGSGRVWPSPVEGALLQGLCNYAVLYGEHELGRNLKRGVQRNIFISRFIYQTINELRTPKQVGSRIQQLRASTKDDDVLKLINCCPVSEEQIQRLLLLASTVTGVHRQLPNADRSHGLNQRLSITLMSLSARYPSRPPEVMLQSPPHDIRLRTLAEWQPSTDITSGMDPTIVLVSPVALALYSAFELFRDNMSCSMSVIALRPDGIRNGQLRYVAAFPDLWQELSDRRQHDDQCTKWSILQLVFFAEDEIAHGKTRDSPFVEIRYNFERPALGVNERQRSIVQPPKDRFRYSTSPLPSPPSRTAQPIPYRENPLLKVEDTFYSIAGTLNWGSGAPLVQKQPSKDVFSRTGMFYPQNFSSAEDNTTKAHYISSSIEELDQNFFDDASVRSCSEAPSLIYSEEETIEKQSDWALSQSGRQQCSCNDYVAVVPTFLEMVHNGVVETPISHQLPFRHAAYSITGEFMGYYPIHHY